MNKKLFSLLVGILGFGMLSAQENFKPSVHVGIPSGDSSDFFALNLGADVAYLYPITDEFGLGGKAGVELFTGKSIPNSNLKNKGATLIPIAGSAQYTIQDSFFVGLDLGFALSISKDYNGGLYFMPKVGMQNDTFQGFVFLKSISSEVDSPTYFENEFKSLMSIGVGAAYKF